MRYSNNSIVTWAGARGDECPGRQQPVIYLALWRLLASDSKAHAEYVVVCSSHPGFVFLKALDPVKTVLAGFSRLRETDLRQWSAPLATQVTKSVRAEIWYPRL